MLQRVVLAPEYEVLGIVGCLVFKCRVRFPVEPPTTLIDFWQWLHEALFGAFDISTK
jgi:hypothetical protein